jgi:poly(hydroxyalkanoate) granule-associated protein
MIKKAKQVQTDVSESAYKIWLAGLGAVAYAQETGGKMFNDLVKRGRDMEAHSRLSTPDMTVTLRGATDRATTAWKHRMGVPTRSEIATLGKRVELLTASVERLKPKARPLAKPMDRPTMRPAMPKS